MTEIAIPFGILSKIWQRLTRRLIQPVLEESHSEYILFKNAERWSRLGNIEYIIHFENKNISNEERPTSWIMVRSIGDKIWKDVKMIITAHSDYSCYEETLFFSSIDKRRNKKTLQNIPLLYAHIHDGYVYTPFSDVRIEILEGNAGEATINKSYKNFVLTYEDWLNGNFTNRWGKWYNIDRIERIKGEFRSRIFLYFHGPFGMPWQSQYIGNYRALDFILKLSISYDKFLYRTFSSNFILNLITWTSIILKIKPIKDPNHPCRILN